VRQQISEGHIDPEVLINFVVSSFSQRWVLHAPVSDDWLTRPHKGSLSGFLADRDHEIELNIV